MSEIKPDIALQLAFLKLDLYLHKYKSALVALAAKEDWESFADLIEAVKANTADLEIIIQDNKSN